MSRARYEFGEDRELDALRTDRNLSRVIAGKVGRTRPKISRRIRGGRL